MKVPIRMDYLERMPWVFVLICTTLVFLASIPAVGADAPLRLFRGPHLFIDDYLIEETKGLMRTTHQPKKLPKPILAKAESWHQQPLFFLKVMPDPSGDLFRMWYNVKNPGGHPSVCFATVG